MFCKGRIGFWVVVTVFAWGAIAPAAIQDDPTSVAAAPVTYQDLVRLLRSGKGEDEILGLLKNSSVSANFALGERQVAELKKMRVSDEFILGLQNKLGKGEAPLPPGSDITDFVVILDCSGSMIEFTPDRRSKMDVAKEATTKLIRGIPDGLRVAFVVYGQNRQQGCNAVAVLRSLAPLDEAGKSELIRAIAGLKPVGNTPIALALRAGGAELARTDGLSKLVLITDGMETCQGDPAKEAVALLQRLRLRDGVEVIGLGLKPAERKAVELIAQAGKGKYYGADSTKELADALVAVGPKTPPPRPTRHVEFGGEAIKPGQFLHDAPRVATGEYKGKLAMKEAHYYRIPVRKGQELRAIGQVQKTPYQASNSVINQSFSITIYDGALAVVARESITVRDNPTILQTLRALWTAPSDEIVFVALAASDNHDGAGNPISVYPDNTVPQPSAYSLRLRVEGDAATEGEPPAPIPTAKVKPGAGFKQAGTLPVPSMAGADLKLEEVIFYRTTVRKGETLRVSAAVQKPWYKAGNEVIEATYTVTIYDDDQVQVAQKTLPVKLNPADGQSLAATWPVAIGGQAYFSVSAVNTGQGIYPENFQVPPGFVTVQVESLLGTEPIAR